MKFASATKVIWELAHKGLVATRCHRQRIFSPTPIPHFSFRINHYPSTASGPPPLTSGGYNSARIRLGVTHFRKKMYLLSHAILLSFSFAGRRGRRPLQYTGNASSLCAPLLSRWEQAPTLQGRKKMHLLSTPLLLSHGKSKPHATIHKKQRTSFVLCFSAFLRLIKIQDILPFREPRKARHT